VLDYNLVLKSDELYLVGDMSTDGSGERATGLYLRDTRHLSQFRVTLNDTTPDRFSAHVHDATSATVTTTNNLVRLPNGDLLPPHQVVLEQAVTLHDGVQLIFTLQNFSRKSLPLELGLEFGSDFRDLFDIRGFPRARRGEHLIPRLEERTVVLGYRGLDSQVVETAVTFDRPASVNLRHVAADRQDELVALLPGFDEVSFEPAPSGEPAALATFEIPLGPGERWELRATVTPRPAGERAISVAQLLRAPEQSPGATVATSNPFFNRVLARCTSDLSSLLTSFPEGALPAAGIPWYVAPFGRDSLIVGLQTYHLLPWQAAGTLRVLAALQGDEIDPTRDEEPGKILHEMRYGEMARCREVPHSPYFGTVDATPLFVWLFAETVTWTADDGLYHDLLPNVRRALEWIDRYGDKDGDGLVEYRTDGHDVGHITHQVWKDSFDSLHHPDGEPATGLIAAVEVQGYVYAAYARLADIVAAHGDASWATELRTKAESIRQKVERLFWLEDEGYYAQALGHDKQPVGAISSNPGHLLVCGLPSADRAAKVADRLQLPDVDSGWGIRTLSTAMATYNPMSYHNGSVWPHDNSLIAAGLYRYGQASAGSRVAEALFAAAQTYPLERLPELYCGFARRGGANDAPVNYPVSCSPQAWAAGSLPLIVRAMLGLHVDVGRRCLVVSPALPAWLNEVTIRGVRVLGQTGSLAVRRVGSEYEVEADGIAVEIAAR
jgi:glycogen debranching enzyme